MKRKYVIKLGRFSFDLKSITVEPYVLLYTYTIHLFAISFQTLIFHKVCLQQQGANSTEFCEDIQKNITLKNLHSSAYHDITTDTSHWILYNNIAILLPSVFTTTLFLGPLGDKVGRKVPIIICCIGELVSVVTGLINAIYMDGSLYYLLLGQFVHGVLGGHSANLMATHSYMGYISTPESRMRRMGTMEAMYFTSGIIAGATSGILLDQRGIVFTLTITLAFNVLALMYNIVWVENVGVAPEDDDPGLCTSLLQFFKGTFRCVVKERARLVLVLVVLAMNLNSFAIKSKMDVLMIYLKENLDFTQTLFGYYNAMESFITGLTLLTFVPLVKRYTSLSNLALVLVGLMSNTTAHVVLGLATQQWVVFLSACLSLLRGTVMAGLRATASSLVSPSEQGKIFGIVAASEASVSLLASLTFNEMYPATVAFFPGLSFVIIGGMYLLCCGLVVVVMVNMPEVNGKFKATYDIRGTTYDKTYIGSNSGTIDTEKEQGLSREKEPSPGQHYEVKDSTDTVSNNGTTSTEKGNYLAITEKGDNGVITERGDTLSVVSGLGDINLSVAVAKTGSNTLIANKETDSTGEESKNTEP